MPRRDPRRRQNARPSPLRRRVAEDRRRAAHRAGKGGDGDQAPRPELLIRGSTAVAFYGTACAGVLHVDDSDSSCDEGFAMGRVRAAEAQGKADAHVRQQIRVELGAEEAAAVHVHPLAAIRNVGMRSFAEEKFARDDGVDGAVLVAVAIQTKAINWLLHNAFTQQGIECETWYNACTRPFGFRFSSLHCFERFVSLESRST